MSILKVIITRYKKISLLKGGSSAPDAKIRANMLSEFLTQQNTHH